MSVDVHHAVHSGQSHDLLDHRLDDGLGARARSSFGELYAGEYDALVFVGKEGRRRNLKDRPAAEGYGGEEQEREDSALRYDDGSRDVAARGARERVVEPLERPALHRLLLAQHVRAHHRRHRQRDDEREADRESDGDGELLVNLSRDSRHEGDWDEYGEEDERRRHHRPGDVLHGLYRSCLRVALVALHKELDAFDDDDSVVDDRTYNEDEAEERKGVDGVADREQRGECAEQRDRYCDRRDERRAPVLKEEVADKYDERERHEEREDDFLDRLLNVLGRVVLHFELHIVGQVRPDLFHDLLNARHDVKGVRA